MRTHHAHLTARDLAILRTLFECRVATYTHLSHLHFAGRFEAAKKRAHKLVGAGYLTARRRHINLPIVLSLTRRSLDALRDRHALDAYPELARQDLSKRMQVSDSTLTHELAVMDVRCAFTAALSRFPACTLDHFSTWPLLHSFHAQAAPGSQKVLVRPDGFFEFTCSVDRDAQPIAFFLEVDRGTETIDTLVTRCLCYRGFYFAGGLARWRGSAQEGFERHPFRVLIVTPSVERRNNIADRLLGLSPPILSQVWLAAQADVVADPLSAIWITPSDFRNAITHSAFERQRATAPHRYRRDVGRDRWLGARIKPRHLVPELAEQKKGDSS